MWIEAIKKAMYSNCWFKNLIRLYSNANPTFFNLWGVDIKDERKDVCSTGKPYVYESVIEKTLFLVCRQAD